MIPGSLKFAQYAFSPNKLELCGPRDKNRTIFDYLSAKRSDPGLIESLEEFEAAYPYISFIAKENNIREPFSKEVVSAYWLGNRLLNQIQPGHFYRFLKERFSSYLKPDDLRGLKKAIRRGGRPSHNFHVFEVFPKTGGMSGQFKPNLGLLDNCRISWGRVVGGKKDELIIERRPLVFHGQKIELGRPEKVRRSYRIKGKSFLGRFESGSVVSIHWNWVCDQLSKKELEQLFYWTKQALMNRTG